jgi:tetratricopeptide (TPR) repeat protein/predicted RNA-binding Zn-ribbon protein involved in translation (DUF1610 family)
MSLVLDFIKRLFSKGGAQASLPLPEELWIADLSSAEAGGFLVHEEEGYGAAYRNGVLELGLKRPGIFAWTEAPGGEYADFVMEGELGFDAASPYSSCGFLFRAGNDANFYALLVSNHGFLRMDAVFNGNPRPVLAWTECPGPLGQSFSLRVIARGSHFIICIDDVWAAEAVDDSFRSGFVAFAGQNYGEGQEALFRLSSLFVETRAFEVEAWHFRRSFVEEVPAAARLRLASTYFAMGEWLKAAVQLHKLEKNGPLEALGRASVGDAASPPLPPPAGGGLAADALLLKAEVSLRLELFEEAEAAIDACLTLAPERREAALEKANLLYLRGRYLELRSFVLDLIGRVGGDARLWTLSGHARFNLGDYIGAAEDYGRAAAAEPGEALLKMNEARAREQAGDRKGAALAYLAAARGFFEAEADEDLGLALARLEELDPRNPELPATRAKVLFRQGRKAEAGAAIDRLLKTGSEDSALHYLSGLLEAEKGRRELALTRFRRAVELEPDYPLYAFRLAETCFLLGRPETEATLARALELAPDDGWTCNLAAQAILKTAGAGPGRRLGEAEAARARLFLDKAVAALPEAIEPRLNLAELESLLGREEEALAVLAAHKADARALNQAGNVLARAGRIEEAGRKYEAAVALEPRNAEYLSNLAAALLELERWTDAEEAVRKALDIETSARTCLLAGNLALVYGDWVRAETAYRLGLEAAPGDAGLLFALGRTYLGARKLKKAEDCLSELAAADPARAERLEAEILEATTEKLGCASCDRTWRVPRNLPAQSGASIRAMPPDDSPAGNCPRCGRVFCIACRKAALVDSRFTCPDCGETLKLSDNRLRWLVIEALKRG